VSDGLYRPHQQPKAVLARGSLPAQLFRLKAAWMTLSLLRPDLAPGAAWRNGFQTSTIKGMIDAAAEAAVELVAEMIGAVIKELLKGDFDDVSGESQTDRSEAESQASVDEPGKHPA
jgi:hypothetical protein